MNIVFGQILEGWRNKLLPPEHLKEEIEKVSAERISICNNCEFHSKNYNSLRPDAFCVDCGCTLSTKTKCLSCSCPKEKWMKILTEEEEKEIKDV
tara:strand:- start:472 stop:756 length:285 start_codon:yes stop_codon:yes gene_type:complete